MLRCSLRNNKGLISSLSRAAARFLGAFSVPQGHHATVDELAASAYQAVEVDQQLNGEPVQVRVSMGKEPRHFLAIFKGKLVIFEVCRGTD